MELVLSSHYVDPRGRTQGWWQVSLPLTHLAGFVFEMGSHISQVSLEFLILSLHLRRATLLFYDLPACVCVCTCSSMHACMCPHALGEHLEEGFFFFSMIASLSRYLPSSNSFHDPLKFLSSFPLIVIVTYRYIFCVYVQKNINTTGLLLLSKFGSYHSRFLGPLALAVSSSTVLPEALAAGIVLWLMHPLGLSTPGLAVLCILTSCGFLQ